jgi:hypothetical protein
MTTEDTRYLCVECWGFIPHGRVKLGYRLCLDCGEAKAKKETHCVVPMPKSNYIVVTDPALLKGLNTSHKGGVA